jgi:hypothetical protein
LAFAEDVCAESLSKDMVSDEELADSMLTHVGGRSLLPELGLGCKDEELAGKHAHSSASWLLRLQR